MKKVISLLLVCLMMISSVAVVSAAEAVTIAGSTVDKSSADVTTATNLDVYVNIDNFPADAVALVQFDIHFDSNKVTLKEVRKGQIVVGPADAEDIANNDYEGDFDTAKSEEGWATPAWNLGKITTDNNGISSATVNYTNNVVIFSNYLANGKTRLATLRFNAVSADVTGDVEITIDNVHFASPASTGTFDLDSAADVTTTSGLIKFKAGEPEPDPEPVATAVKTFAKRLYVDNTLYTVGVISEGTNYATETIKAGIRIDKAGVMVPYWTNNAPVSDGKGTSYYAVALNGVTAETDIKAESVSKAVITVNGGAEISGDEVSANDTSVE